LLESNQDALLALDEIESGFLTETQLQMDKMWAAKLGLSSLDKAVLNELHILMMQTPVDYTIFFRELSSIPDDMTPLKKSFYTGSSCDAQSIAMDKRWSEWLAKWKSCLHHNNDDKGSSSRSLEEVSKQMKLVNPKFILREWLVVPAYQQATVGDYALIRELQEVMTNPYAEQSKDVEDKYYRLKPREQFEVGGVSHLSCSS